MPHMPHFWNLLLLARADLAMEKASQILFLLFSCLHAQNCGLVVEAHIIDERSEWRTFSDKVCLGVFACWGKFNRMEEERT